MTKKSVIRESKAYKNALAIIEKVKSGESISPHEGYSILSADPQNIDPDLSRAKTTFLTLVTKLKNAINKNGASRRRTKKK